ncbi:uncharacterized conserved protein [Azorhizobium caulinodans ORS 571]|uniref:Uncharacterized conserved protein n=1 Tax=Azorhizobium caulinodans (strain ATCC 43989 / DSM 5975 / JCM 20966 / LMG 6465 / NBRC 14845 / NCIMB 13405 / ORS 571) TaxID=438753 RepID=A8IQ83_AZOC5|nr:YkvA family protein [Azorhizobium caulinodans]BAF86753.1 uncharacterized conserved protein [Azorhizobium caulinodans ORS 571]
MNTSHTSDTDWGDLPGDDRSRAAEDEARVRSGFWQKLKGGAARVPFAGDAIAAYYAAFDRETPLRVRAALLGALAYFVLPIDTVPDFIPIVGFGDDAAVLFGALQLLANHIKPHHREAADEALRRAREG